MDALFAGKLYKGLKTRTLGRRAVILDEVDSTNLEVRRMLEHGSAEGVAVIAGRQTLGRGRRGRRWVSEPGCGLWMSVAVNPVVPPDQIQQITLAAGVAVCRAIEDLAGEAAKPVIKWPNDVLIEGKKVCGILCEAVNTLLLSPAGDIPSFTPPSSREVPPTGGERSVTAIKNQDGFIIIGIGVNTKRPKNGWGEADGIAVSLEEVTGRSVPRMALAASMLNHMEELLDAMRSGGFAAIAGEYRKRMLPAGSAVIIIDGVKRWRGTIEGIEDAGGLLVRLENGQIESIVSGEITLRGVGGYV